MLVHRRLSVPLHSAGTGVFAVLILSSQAQSPSMTTALFARPMRLCALLLASAMTLAAQAKPKVAAAVAAPAAIVGAWSGTATVPLGDSTIVVPVTYTFTQSGTTVSGTAMVPGQGSGPIGNVVRDGPRLRFRVTAPEGKLLEHDGKFTTDGSIEGMVNMDNLPVAKFRIAPRRAPSSAPAK
jgi:hypothetical protein